MKRNRKTIYTQGAAIISASSAVGKKEYEGPLGKLFDFHDPSDTFGQPTFEKSEGEMQRIALASVMSKIGKSAEDFDMIFAGDLLNQCVSSAYGLLEYDIPYFGLYGACSTAAEGIMLASVFVSQRIASLAAAVTSSHNAAAERQYRNPLEYGGQRTPTAQWTVTGAGAFALAHADGIDSDGAMAYVKDVFPGIVVEKGITDAANMGAAMAPAAADTLLRYFEESKDSPSDYDLILTGDLGFEGSELLKIIAHEHGLELGGVHNDCGRIIYHKDEQDVHSGGSGCGCSGIVFGSYILPKLCSGEIKKMLLCPTGALMNPASIQQGQSILGICHLLKIEAP